MPTLTRPPVPTYEGRPLHHPDEALFDQGLAFDVETLISRRSMLAVLGLAGASAGLLVACGPGATTAPEGTQLQSGAASAAASAAGSASATGSAAAAADCTVIPEETAGPFPGDGSNGPDVLTQAGVVRADIRSSFGSSTTTAQGVPLTIKLAILDLGDGCKPLTDAAVYAWHCDRDGNYSMYSNAAVNENYLRGVQAADADGIATFTSIFPGCYSGRWPHVHFEVYRTLDAATNPANRIATSQIALPQATCTEVYATDGYGSSVANLARVSLATDNVFGDDAGIHQVGAVTGSISGGLTVELPVPVQTS